MRHVLLALALLPALAQAEDEGAEHLEIKWMRDSIEYQSLTQQVYTSAEQAVLEQASDLKRRESWTVVLDVDETVLDNTTYSLERAAYDQGFDWPSWDAWCERRNATPIPGVEGFLQAVRDAGGRVAFITNRHERTRQATLDNLAAYDLYQRGDVLCMLTDDDAYTKRVRRTQLRTGEGPCSWEGTEVTVLAYLGDTIHDLPEDGEDGAFSDNLGARAFVLPNPTYGSFEGEVTRRLP